MILCVYYGSNAIILKSPKFEHKGLVHGFQFVYIATLIYDQAINYNQFRD